MRRCTLGVLFALALTIGCSDNNEDNNTNNTNNTQKDMTPDQTGDMSGDMDMTGDQTGDMVSGDPCQFHTQCEADEVCLGDICRKAPDCENETKWGTCGVALSEMVPNSSDRAICYKNKCITACLYDTECEQGKVCGDDGICIDYPSEVTGKHPGGEAKRRIKVGAANQLLNVPIGINAAGYGGGGARSGRYVDAMTPSNGLLHGLYNRAIALDNGERQMILLRSPLIFPTGPLHEAVAQKLQKETGADWRDSLIISGTHTHSGPGRFFHLPDASALPLGPLGTDLFHQQIFDWMSESLYQTAKAALDDLEDGKLGWTIMESFDTDDEIASDRWGATPKFDDNRALFIRIDGPDDRPKAILMSFGMHGTWNSDRPYLTADAAGSVERALENALGKEYDKHIPTMFFNASGGSMSPRGDRRGHSQSHKFEYMGLKFVEKVFDTVKSIEMKEDIDLAGATRRFPITYEGLGYKDKEFVDIRGKKDNLKYGGLQCNVGGAEDDDYATHARTDQVRCLGLHSVLYNRPPTIFVRSQVSAISIDGLTVVTLPGEPAMEIGWQVLREIRDKLNVDPLKSFTFGYAQDHKFYMVPDNLRGEMPPFPGISLEMKPDDYPDYAISYFQGGYEAGFMPWGHRFAPYLADRIVEAVAMMQGTPMEMKIPQIMPMYYSRRDSGTFDIDISTNAIGTITQDMPAQAKRLEVYEFAWIGGDPGAEMPQTPGVVLERKAQDGSWAPVIHTNMRPYDNREPLMITRTRKKDADWEWVIYWEELHNFPTGTYRFNVSGHYQSAEGRKPYTLTSREFEVIPTDTIEFSEVAYDTNTNAFTGKIGYPAAAKLIVNGPNADPGKMTGSYRLRHPAVPTGVSDPVLGQFAVNCQRKGTAQSSMGPVTVADETVAGRNGVPVSRFTCNLNMQANQEVEFTITDAWGNSGTVTYTVMP